MDIVKHLFKRTTNLIHGLKAGIVFVHVPKCGGTSISNAIRWHYITLDIRKDKHLVELAPAATYRVIKMVDNINYPYDTTNDYPTLHFREELLLYFLSQKDTRYVTGHFAFSEVAHREFSGKYSFITVLRDPVKRWISLYFYNRYKEHDHCKVDIDLERYLHSDFGRSQGFDYVKFFGGPDESGNYTAQTSIDRAIKNLHKFDVVGILEDADNFVQQFQKRFGVKLELKRANQNPKSDSYIKSVITKDILEEIKGICKPDLEVYQYALSIIKSSSSSAISTGSK